MIDVSICIVTYNSQDYITGCINSIKEKTASINYEILVIDNASSDNTTEKFEIFNDIKFIKNVTNTGYAQAANTIAKEARGKYLLFLNPDMILKNNAIDILFQTAENNTDCSLFGGKILNTKDNYIFSFGILPTLNDIFFICSGNKQFIKPKKRNINIEQITEIITGCCFFINKETFESLHGFDENYFMYYEEIDFCKRMKEKNYKAFYTPNAEFIHYIAKSERSKYLTCAYNLRSAFLYCKKHFKNKINIFMLKTIFLGLLFFQKENTKNTQEFLRTLSFILKR